jgi:hypothetical protein
MADWMRRRQRLPGQYQEVFTGDAGQAVLADLARECGLLGTSMVAGDPGMTAFNEGKRAALLHIMGRLRQTPADVQQMAEAMREQEEATF